MVSHTSLTINGDHMETNTFTSAQPRTTSTFNQLNMESVTIDPHAPERHHEVDYVYHRELDTLWHEYMRASKAEKDAWKRSGESFDALSAWFGFSSAKIEAYERYTMAEAACKRDVPLYPSGFPESDGHLTAADYMADPWL